MKKQIKKLTFLKEKVSTLNVFGGKAPDNGDDVPAGPDKGPATFMAEGCGTSVHRPMCEAS